MFSHPVFNRLAFKHVLLMSELASVVQVYGVISGCFLNQSVKYIRSQPFGLSVFIHFKEKGFLKSDLTKIVYIYGVLSILSFNTESTD